MEARIIGLKGCGKTTLVAALAEGRGEGHVATVHVGDARVRALSEIFLPKKTTFAEFKVREVAWPEATGRKGEMERYLDALGGGQVYVHVLRGFDSPMLGEAGPSRRPIWTNSTTSSCCSTSSGSSGLSSGPRRRPSPTPARRPWPSARRHLEAETPLREVDFDEADLTFIRGYQFLTLTPQLLVLNTESGRHARHRGARGPARGRRLLAFPFPDALEVSQLSIEEQAEYAAALGLPGPAAEVVAQAAFEQLGLISFLTTGSDEVRAWPIRSGETAKEAAGAIHSDIQRGFIRAEIISYDDFMTHNASMKAAREAGVLRVEGKDYIVQDGDIVNFRFNV